MDSESGLWHGTTAQISRRTTTLPVVTSSENGRGITYTRVSDFDSGGYLTSSTDERGTVTTYLLRADLTSERFLNLAS